MSIIKYADTPSKRLGVVSIFLSIAIILVLAAIWNINKSPFIYREEIQPLGFSVPIKKPADNSGVQKDYEGEHSKSSGLFGFNKEYLNPSHATVYLDKQCFYAEAKGQSWLDLSEEKQNRLMDKCSAQKFGRRYEWKTSFADFFRSITKQSLFHVSIFLLLSGAFLIVGIPQRLAIWIQKGK